MDGGAGRRLRRRARSGDRCTRSGEVARAGAGLRARRRARRPRGAGGGPPSRAGEVLPRVAARDGHAVERLVEDLLVEAEPAAQGFPRTAPPRAQLHTLDDPGRLTDEERTLTRVPLEDWVRLDSEAGLRARPAGAVVALQGGKRPIRGAPADLSKLALLVRDRAIEKPGYDGRAAERCPSGLRSATGNRVPGESWVAGSNPALSA